MPEPQEVRVREADPWMEKPIEVAVTERLNDHHTTTTKFWLTRESAHRLIYALTDHLGSEG